MQFRGVHHKAFREQPGHPGGRFREGPESDPYAAKIAAVLWFRALNCKTEACETR